MKLAYRIPLGVVDIDDLGLLAEDSRGDCYLCRQKRTNRNRVLADESEKFADGWTGPSYKKFNVSGSSSTRTYHAIVRLTCGAEIAVEDLANLMLGVSQLDG